jgi:hypothetical protein
VTGESAGGRWVDLERQLYTTEVVCCSCCGVMLPRRFWDIGLGLTRPYCSAECRTLEERLALLRKDSGGQNPFQSLGGDGATEAATLAPDRGKASDA